MGDIAELYEGFEEIDLSENWNNGFHIIKDGEEIELKDMTTEHLKNTIKYFKDKFDTTALGKELKKRKVT